MKFIFAEYKNTRRHVHVWVYSSTHSQCTSLHIRSYLKDFIECCTCTVLEVVNKLELNRKSFEWWCLLPESLNRSIPFPDTICIVCNVVHNRQHCIFLSLSLSTFSLFPHRLSFSNWYNSPVDFKMFRILTSLPHFLHHPFR